MISWLPHFALILISLLLAGCTAPTPTAAPHTPIPSLAAPTLTTTALPAPSQTSVPNTAPALPTLTPVPSLAVCSPLAGIAQAELPGMVSNPFLPPAPGSDNPHQGVDLAILDPVHRIALSGSTVQAVLPGQVAMLLKDRFPYGYAVLIETPLDAATSEWWAQAGIPTPAPTLAPRSALSCPNFSLPPHMDSTQRSAYVLYAHLQSIEDLIVGQPVTCGQALGTVGMSGNALNPHLHVEVRAAPAGIRLGSMAHYDSSASQDEMAAYCLWRVSGLFQLTDPLNFMVR